MRLVFHTARANPRFYETFVDDNDRLCALLERERFTEAAEAMEEYLTRSQARGAAGRRRLTLPRAVCEVTRSGERFSRATGATARNKFCGEYFQSVRRRPSYVP